MADPRSAWETGLTSGAAWIGAVTGVVGLVWQRIEKALKKRDQLRQLLQVNTVRFGVSNSAPPQSWRTKITYQPKESGEGVELKIAFW